MNVYIKKDSYLQVGDGSVGIQGVLPQQALLVQELPCSAIEGRLEEPVVEHILQAVVEGAQNALLGGPHGNVRIQPQTLLWRDRRAMRAAAYCRDAERAGGREGNATAFAESAGKRRGGRGRGSSV